MTKPIIKELQQFSDRYFYNWKPKVEYRRVKALGMATLKLKKIYIHPIQSSTKFNCYGFLFQNNVRFRGNETYYAILLHEIAHFKIKKVRCTREDVISFAESMGRLCNGEFDSDYTYQYAKRELQHLSLEHAVESWALKEFKKRFRGK